MSSDIKTNGHVSVTTLAATVGSVVGALLLFINLSIAPLQKDIEQNKQDIADIRQNIVPRKEHEKDWAAQVKTDGDQDRRIEQIREDFGSTYSLKDALSDMRLRLEKLETGKQKDR